MRVGREIDRGHIYSYRFRGGENSSKVIVYYVYSGEVRMGGDNGVEEGVDGGKGGCIGADIVLYVYLVSSYRPSHSSLS